MEKENAEGNVNNNSMLLSWLWDKNEYDLSDKLEEIKHTMFEPYHYGEADIHAGAISENIRSEINRNHRITELDERIEKIGKTLDKYDLD